MSLISDALRKARQEAAERETKERDGVVPPMVLEGAGRFGSGVIVGAMIAVVATVVGAYAVWVTVDRSPVGTALEPPVVAVTTGEPASSPPQSKEQIPASTHAPGGQVSVENDADAEPPQELIPTPTPAAADAEKTASQPEPDFAGIDDSSIETEVPEDSGRERDFVIDARLGYVTLSLELLVYRSVDSWAEINGREVRVGSKVEGFEVEAIEKYLVRLRDERGPLVLRVR